MVLQNTFALSTNIAQGSLPGRCESTQPKELDHPRTFQGKSVGKVLTEVHTGKIESKGAAVV